MGGLILLVLVLLAAAVFVVVRRRNKQLAAERAVREREPVKKLTFEDVVLVEGLPLSLATTHQVQVPLVRPERFTLHTLFAPWPAENDCARPLPCCTLMDTLFTPLASVTVAENVAEAPTVAPAAGDMFVTVGPAPSPAMGVADALCPYGVSEPSRPRRNADPFSSITRSRGIAAALRSGVQCSMASFARASSARWLCAAAC